MAFTSTPGGIATVLTRIIRVLALLEIIDALVYTADAGWGSAPPIIIGLTAGGIVGAVLTWVPRSLAVVGAGGLLVAIAPAVAYPLSVLLALCSLAIIVLAMMPRQRRSIVDKQSLPEPVNSPG